MTMTWKDCPVRANAFCLSSDRRASSAAMFPADKPSFDIFSPPPGESDVINQVERLSSNETKIAPRSVLRNGERVTSVASRLSGFATSVCALALAAIHSPWDLQRPAPSHIPPHAPRLPRRSRPASSLSYGSFTARPNTTIRPDAFRGMACCGSDPTGHANSRAGNHFPPGNHQSSRLDTAHNRTDDRRRPAHDTSLGHIRPPRGQCRQPEQL
jgi:hypothetical protein